jgi:hypothetical protein
MKQGRMISTEILPRKPGEPLRFEHPRVFFPSYPWEWTPGQWKHAASLTLDLCEEAVRTGYILKDATPLNILFSGSRSVFVDVLSFERRDQENPLWIAYAQFVRTFLLPLAAYVYLGWPLSATQHRRDGYECADLAPWLRFTVRWSSPLRSLVTFPILLEKSLFDQELPSLATRRKPPDSSSAALQRTLRSARKILNELTLPYRSSRWSGYAQSAGHYSQEDQSEKQDFVRQVLSTLKPKRTLDVGANAGVYSRIAAEAGAEVVAWDSDVQASDANWRKAVEDGISILPVVADFARPTPAVGWQNAENLSLLERSRGQFGCVLMLGILHHLLVADQIPLSALLDQLALITSRWAILEWVPREDSQFKELCRGREDLYAHLTEDHFLAVLSSAFIVQRSHRLANGRRLVVVEKAG